MKVQANDCPAIEGERKTVVLFADIAGASEVSNHLPATQYSDFVRMFQSKFESLCEESLCVAEKFFFPKIARDEYSYGARGDEGILMIYPAENSDSKSLVPRCVNLAVHVALNLKRDWFLFSGETDARSNEQRINSDILPIDLGIGIHVGTTYVSFKTSDDPQTPDKLTPEGYAINLAKRVEAHSRTGRYSKIFVSEAAHGALEQLSDEKQYLFSEPSKLSAKGFSRDFHAFEIKHHFLQTGWSEDIIDDHFKEDGEPDGKKNRRERAKIYYRPPSTKQISLLKRAHESNPTNLWLGEEYINGLLAQELRDIIKCCNSRPDAEKDLEDESKMDGRYAVAAKVASYLAQSELRDPGILMIQGLIDGERLKFAEEQSRYDDAREFKTQIALLEYYQGSSLSSRVSALIDWDQVKQAEAVLTRSVFTDENIFKNYKLYFRTDTFSYNDAKKASAWIDKAIVRFRKSVELSPSSAWYKYSLGCELTMWGTGDVGKREGPQLVKDAWDLLPDIADYIEDEEYLSEVRKAPAFASWFDDAKNKYGEPP